MGHAVSTDHCPKHTVEIPSHGTLTGVTLKRPSGKPTVHRFAKVPYALPPKARFGLPIPIPDDYDYTGEYERYGAKCPQPVYESKELVYAESPSDESIQYLNIWVPASNKYRPQNGWPVLVYIHGGWLQYGDINNEFFNSVELMDDEHFKEKYIFVTPAYRLNIFGFLTCNQLEHKNLGFWDQREALKWVHRFIVHFGGDPSKITLSGLSAGAYSTFFQLAYELYHPNEEQIIKQVIFHSNMILTQPKSITECKAQYSEIVDKLGIGELNPQQQLQRLQSLDYKFLERFIPTLNLHTFRAVTDDDFVSSTTILDIMNGKFSELLVKKGVRIMHGEVDNEGYLYSLLNPPVSVEEFQLQVENYYPREVTLELMEVYNVVSAPETKLSTLFGNVIGDGQVYVSTRGFINNIVENGFPAKDYFRYRIAYRGKWLDKHLSPELKVTHAHDKPIWFYALRAGFTEKEKARLDEFLIPYLEFLNFHDDIKGWETSNARKLRLFKSDGSIVYEDDVDWERCTQIAKKLYEKQLD
ncbi:hypothetical protein CAS74_000017 [Pichia kudriavzevii]|uniref:Carboxylic ester hydrolase n=1 Tax=Pichia kudriavzevii TaxID=4909 RepID=A0A1Z8JSY9_PICKU|nr:hypothetical protein CAS74_000017 [Pichia kudriavzevii]